MFVAGVIAAALAVGLFPAGKTYDGLWPLSVTIHSASGAQIAAATGEAFSSEESARRTVEDAIPAEPAKYGAVADPFRGDAIEVPVPTARTSLRALLWGRTSFYQHGTLVVVRYAGGRRKAVSAAIPDLRETREVAITVP